jgi:hypothetical protein
MRPTTLPFATRSPRPSIAPTDEKRWRV